MPTYVALLRGINVGGKHLVPMAELRELFESTGATEVRTYIQSGNVVYVASAGGAAKLAERIEAAFHVRFGFRSPFVVRSATEFVGVIAANPFVAAGVDPKMLHVMFLAHAPQAAAIAALDPLRSAPDRFTVQGREIYLHLPGGAGNSKLTSAYFDSKLITISTGRNWNTALKLAEMAGA